jgi:outer membrane protein
MRLILPLTFLLFCAGALAAQTFEKVPEAQAKPAPAVVTTGAKIGVINIQLAMNSTQEFRKAAENFRTKFEPRQNELEQLRQEVQDLERQLGTQSRTLSAEAQNQLARQIERKRKQGQRLQEDLQEEAQQARNDMNQRIGEKLIQVITQYAQQSGLGVVLNWVPGGPAVFYVAPGVDITNEVIRLYDQTYPAQEPTSEPSSSN